MIFLLNKKITNYNLHIKWKITINLLIHPKVINSFKGNSPFLANGKVVTIKVYKHLLLK